MPAACVPPEEESSLPKLSPNTDQASEKLIGADYGTSYSEDFNKPQFEDQAGPSQKSNFGRRQR